MANVAEAIQRALQYQQAGDLASAERIYRQVLEVAPDHPDALHLLGVICFARHELAAAEELLRRVVARHPQVAMLQNNLGNVYFEQRRFEAAAECYQRAIWLKPDYVEAHSNLGASRKEQGRFDEAAACCRRAIELDPRYAPAHNNLGLVCKNQLRVKEAMTCFRRALEEQPNYVEALVNLAGVLDDEQSLNEAVACFDQALRLRPQHVEALCGLGRVLQEQGKLAEAMDCYQRALQRNPDHAQVRWNQSLAWLLTGDFERGWPAYEWRWKVKPMKGTLPQLPQPRWDGTPSGHQTVLLMGEQGLGDTLQFIRYAPLVKQRCRTLCFLSQRPLVSLLSRTPGIDRQFAELASAPPFDAQTPLLSVPGILGTRLQTIPSEVPYLFADPELVARWRIRLQNLRGVRIGINWRGRPGPGPWTLRDLPLPLFSTLAAVPDVQVISLQKGATSDELAQLREAFPIVDFGDDLDDAHGAFMDSAAIMMNLDLVITSDTAVPHLAGGLGVPVWTALPFAPDWRWMLHRTDSPWYPTMRLFRQPATGDWESVFRELARALRERLETARE